MTWLPEDDCPCPVATPSCFCLSYLPWHLQGSLKERRGWVEVGSWCAVTAGLSCCPAVAATSLPLWVSCTRETRTPGGANKQGGLMPASRLGRNTPPVRNLRLYRARPHLLVSGGTWMQDPVVLMVIAMLRSRASSNNISSTDSTSTASTTWSRQLLLGCLPWCQA